MSTINAASFLPPRQVNLPTGPDPSYMGVMGRLAQTVSQPMPGGGVPRGTGGQQDAQLLDIIAGQVEGARNRRFQAAQQQASIAAQQQMNDQNIAAHRAMHSETLTARTEEAKRSRAFEDALEARRALLEGAREEMRNHIERLNHQYEAKQDFADEAFKLGTTVLSQGGGPQPGTEARAQLDAMMQEAGRIMQGSPMDMPEWAAVHTRYLDLQAQVLGTPITGDGGMDNLRRVAEAQRNTPHGLLAELPDEIRPKGPDGLPVADRSAVRATAAMDVVSDNLVTGMLALYDQQGVKQEKFRESASRVLKAATRMKTQRQQTRDLTAQVLRTDPKTGQHMALDGIGSAFLAASAAQPDRPPMEVLMETVQQWAPGVAQALTESGKAYDPVSYNVATTALQDIANRIANDIDLIAAAGNAETARGATPSDADAAIGAFRRMAPATQSGQSPWATANRKDIKIAVNKLRPRVRGLLGEIYQAEAGLRAKWGPTAASADEVLNGLIGPEGQIDQQSPLLTTMANTLVNAKSKDEAEQQIASWFDSYTTTSPAARETVAVLRGERSQMIGPPGPSNPLDAQAEMMGSLGMGPNPSAPPPAPAQQDADILDPFDYTHEGERLKDEIESRRPPLPWGGY